MIEDWGLRVERVHIVALVLKCWHDVHVHERFSLSIHKLHGLIFYLIREEEQDKIEEKHKICDFLFTIPREVKKTEQLCMRLFEKKRNYYNFWAIINGFHIYYDFNLVLRQEICIWTDCGEGEYLALSVT